MKCFLYLIQIFEIRQLGFDQLDGERHFFSPTGGAMLKWWRPLNWAMWKIQQETQTDFKKEQGIRANHYWFKNLLKCQVKMGYILNEKFLLNLKPSNNLIFCTKFSKFLLK